MKAATLIRGAALLVCLGLSGQEGPSLFQLNLPDFFETWFSGTNNLIEVPDRPIRRLSILVRDAQSRNINPGRYRITVNGKGLGNVLEERTTTDGTLLVMDPESLRKRPDELFDARENAIEVAAEDRRGRRYYQNWIVRVNDSQQNAMFGFSSSVSREDPKAVPPDLVITEPTVPPSFRGAEPAIAVVVKGRMSSGAALKVNGQPAVSSKLGAIVTFEYTATVTPSQHELIVEAVDGKGGARRAIIPVYHPLSTAPRARFGGQKYAVLIGISQFGNGKEFPPPLSLAAADVRQLAQALETQAGFKPDNIRVLTDEKATLQLVRVALSDFAAKAQGNDLLVTYFATHGLHDPRPNRGDKLYLALSGTQLPTMDSTALPFSDLELMLSRSVRTNQCFLMFDVGHELRDDWQFRAGRNLVNNHVLNLFSDKPGWSILVSASSDEVSLDNSITGKASSLFSKALAQGLGGAADLNGDGVITARELFGFVTEKVKTDSKGNQQPRFRLPAQAAEQPIGSQ